MMKPITKHANFYFLLFTFTFLLFTLNGFAQTCSPAPVGLVSWWQGENNALDSRSGNNGTLQNGAGFAVGKVGQTFSLDGVNDFVEVPNSAKLNLQQLTIESWVFPTSDISGGVSDSLSFILAKESLSTNQYVIGRKNNTACGTGIGIPTGNFAFYLEGLSGLPNECSGFIDGNAFLPLNTWSHVALTYDGVNVRAFVNGNLTRTIAATGTIPATTGSVQIGGRIRGGTSFWAGNIDEPSIYNRALSTAEIQATFNAGTAGKCKPTATVSPSGLVGWWSGDGNTNDIAGTNNGTIFGTSNFTVGKVGQGFQFTAISDTVSVPDNASLDLTTAITIETWVMPQQIGNAGNNTTLLFKGNLGVFSLQSYGLIYDSAGNIVFRIGNGSTVQQLFGGVLPLNTFTHLVATYDGTTMRFYVNGILTGSAASSIGTMLNTSDPLLIGSNGGAAFVGKLDEVSIYNRAITQAEVTAIFNAGIAGKLKQNATINTSSLVSLWQGEGNANDTRGVNNGSLQNGTTFATGKIGQAFSLDGVDDFVQLPSNPSLNQTSISVEGWINPNATQNSIGGMIYTNRIQGITEGFTFGINAAPNNNIILILQTAGGAATLTTPTNSVQFGVFQHIAVTYNENTGTTSAFINGLPVPLSITGSLSGPLFSPGNPVIGRRETGAGSGNFNGLIDELAIYNRALSPTEVRANYEAGNALSTVVGDARVTFPTVTTAGITNQIPLDLGSLPTLPSGSTTTGLTYDFATSAMFTGSPQVCFNLPSITTSGVFNNLRILHLESNSWINRTDLASINFATRTICSFGLSSLSPFAVVNGFAPTAAEASISGRVTTANGRGIRNVVVQISGGNVNEVRYVRTNPFGYYRFSGLDAGQTYILNVRAKQYSFTNPTRVITLNEDLTDEDFVSNTK